MNPKVLLLTFTTLFAFLQQNQAQWLPQGENALPDTQRVASIAIVNENTVWAVAFYDRTPAPVPSDLTPYLLRTTDGGINWETLEISAAQGRICQDIFAIDDSTAWITTNGLTSDTLRGLFKTTDGGQTWMEKYDHPAGGGLIHFFNDTSGIALHEKFIAHTLDGGESWTPTTPSDLPFINNESIFYTAGNNALAVIGDTLWIGTTFGRVFRSINQGLDWEALDTPFDDNDIIISSAFRNAQEGIIISYSELNQDAILFHDSTQIAVTADGGDTWTALDTFLNFKINCITAIPNTDSTFLSVSNGLASLSEDSGNSWQNFSFRPYNAVSFLTDQLGWVGNGQTSAEFPAALYKWEGILSSTSSPTPSTLDLRVFPNPFDEVVHFHMNILDWEKWRGLSLQLEIFDLLGQRVRSLEVSSPTLAIDIPSGNHNIYFYRLQSQGQLLAKGKILHHKN